MHTDRELLELAAKAVQIKGTWNDRGQCIVVTNCAGIPEQYWRPLEDDGDALRLAYQLGLRIHWFGPLTEVRRAVVRAAAAIGAAM